MFVDAIVSALRLWRQDEDEAGQGGLEYALTAGVVVVAIIVAFQNFPIGEIVTNALDQVQGLIGS
jgi:Flp pilus assembly pilin Flp